MLKMIDERYYVPLLIDSGIRKNIPTYLFMCEKRLASLYRKLKADPINLKRFDNVIKEQERSGIIERSFDNPPKGSVHHLPTGTVIKPERETMKLRVCHDASITF